MLTTERLYALRHLKHGTVRYRRGNGRDHKPSYSEYPVEYGFLERAGLIELDDFTDRVQPTEKGNRALAHFESQPPEAG